MLSISEKLDNSVQTYVHCSLRDRILTLHSHSLDEYSERELELLSKIEASVSKENKKNELTPQNLALLIKKPEEKKLLWDKMQALLNDD